MQPLRMNRPGIAHETIILGIDPGSRVTGYGVIKLTGSTITCLDSGVVTAQTGSMADRLQKIYQGLRCIADRHQPQEAAIEKVFSHINPGGALILGQARGVAFLSMAESGIKKIEEYTARQVKQAVVGYGAASKEQVRFMIQSLLTITHDLVFDAADALAIAICHAHSRGARGNDATAPCSKNEQLQMLLKQYPKGWRRGRR